MFLTLRNHSWCPFGLKPILLTSFGQNAPWTILNILPTKKRNKKKSSSFSFGHGFGQLRPESGFIRLPGSTESDFKNTRKMVKKWFSEPPENMVKKWSFDGSGPPQKMCPKSGQEINKKLTKIVPAKTWDHLNTIFLKAFDNQKCASFWLYFSTKL